MNSTLDSHCLSFQICLYNLIKTFPDSKGNLSVLNYWNSVLPNKCSCVIEPWEQWKYNNLM